MRRKRQTVFTRIMILMTFMLISVSPHLQADFGVFGVSEDYAQVTEADVEAVDEISNDASSQAVDTLQSYLYALQPDMKVSDLMNLDYDLFNSYLSGNLDSLMDTEKGKIVGQYDLLPSELMELVLYEIQDTDTQGVFGLQSMGDSEQDNQHPANYTIEAQSKLLEGLKVFYGFDTAEKLDLSDSLLLTDKSQFVTQNAGIELNLLPGMLLNADYKRTLEGEDSSSKAHKTFQLAYNPFSFASFNAGYGIISSEVPTIDPESVPVWLADAAQNEVRPEINDLDDIIIKQLGLAVRPTNSSSLFADYVSVKGNDEQINKAVFGLKLGDNGKAMNATYQLENQKSQITTSAGLELGLVDQATLKAVYSTTQDQQVSEDILETMIDLGLNFNIAESSVLSFQYKWILPEEYDPEDETTAEAKLEVKF